MEDHSRKLILNVAPVTFQDGEVPLGVQPYKDEYEFRQMRLNHIGSHMVRRYKDEIIDIPLAANHSTLGTPKKTNLSENLGVVASLIREAIIQHLYSLGRILIDYDPITVVSEKRWDLLLQVAKQHVPENLISVRPAYELAVRVLQFEGQAIPFIGVALNIRSTKRIDASCEELRKLGMPLQGLYVGHYSEQRDPRIRPRFTLLGAVADVRKSSIVLMDARPGFSEIEESKAYPDADFESLARLYAVVFGSRASEISQKLRTAESRLQNGLAKLAQLKKTLGYFSKLQLQFGPGLQFTIGDFLTEPTGIPKVLEAADPTFVFDPNGIKTDKLHYRGLNQHGPFSRQEFSPNKPRICVVCQRNKQGRVEQLIHKFLNGMEVGFGGEPFKAGLLGKYRLTGAQTEFFLVDGSDSDSYRKTCMAAIEKMVEENFRWTLALVQIDEAFHELRGEQNPYYVSKATFLTHQVPIQLFKIETATFPASQLAYSLNNMALATYAKMGGVPWLLKANPTIAHELVIGLGSAVIKSSRMGQQKRYVGITTIFTGDGNYRLSNISKAVDFDDYASEVLESLRKTISKLKTELNWQNKEHVRLIFHVFKPLKNSEAAAVQELMKEIGDFDADFAFLHVAQEHPYVLFDEAEKGILIDAKQGLRKGSLCPTRGTFLHLSDWETLICLLGARDIKRPEHGMPKPALLKLHKSSTFTDKTYLARQVSLFAAHSWRSFFPAELPVTIYYSQLIARMLGNLGSLPYWNPEVMIGRISNTRWFL